MPSAVHHGQNPLESTFDLGSTVFTVRWIMWVQLVAGMCILSLSVWSGTTTLKELEGAILS
jgi:hypothetical protein